MDEKIRNVMRQREKKNENHEEKKQLTKISKKKLHNFPEKTKTVLGPQKNLLLYRKRKFLHFFSSLMKNSPTGKEKHYYLMKKNLENLNKN